MRIDSSNIVLGAESLLSKETVKQESLQIWNRQNELAQSVQEEVDWSDEAKAYMDKSLSATSNEDQDETIFEMSDQDKLKVRMIEDMLYWITGKKVKLHVPQSIRLKNENTPVPNSNTQQVQGQNSRGNGFGLHYTYFEQKTEQESLEFKAEGQVKTQDGKAISFDLNVNVARTLTESKSIDIRMGEALCDPLVISFDSDVPSLHGKTIQFDIDTDGKLDELPFFNNSGYLALDKNGDGKINDGSELFGPATQNGFAELANYDEDQNGWIDENDPIFSKLVVWTMDANGNQELLAAIRADVGAIYLGNVDTKFRLLNSENDMVGNMSRAGIYLKESGGVSIVEHIDVKL